MRTFLFGSVLAVLVPLAPVLLGGSGDPMQEPSAPTPLALANDYLDAYEAFDWDRLREHYANNVIWQDPTGPTIGASAEEVSGKAAVIDHLKAATRGLNDVDFDFTTQFHSAGVVVNIGTFSYSMPHPDPARDDGAILFSLDTVIVLELKEGKVVRHTDFADFETWLVQYEEQQ